MKSRSTAYLLVGAVLFVCGVVCMATKRNGIGVLMGVELVLNGANINFVAFSRQGMLGLDGQVIALFVIVLAAAEAAVALAIALNFYNNHLTIDVDRGQELRRLMNVRRFRHASRSHKSSESRHPEVLRLRYFSDIEHDPSSE